MRTRNNSCDIALNSKEGTKYIFASRSPAFVNVTIRGIITNHNLTIPRRDRISRTIPRTGNLTAQHHFYIVSFTQFYQYASSLLPKTRVARTRIPRASQDILYFVQRDYLRGSTIITRPVYGHGEISSLLSILYRGMSRAYFNTAHSHLIFPPRALFLCLFSLSFSFSRSFALASTLPFSPPLSSFLTPKHTLLHSACRTFSERDNTGIILHRSHRDSINALLVNTRCISLRDDDRR